MSTTANSLGAILDAQDGLHPVCEQRTMEKWLQVFIRLLPRG